MINSKSKHRLPTITFAKAVKIGDTYGVMDVYLNGVRVAQLINTYARKEIALVRSSGPEKTWRYIADARKWCRENLA